MKINFELRKNVSTAHAAFSFIENIKNTVNSYVFVFTSLLTCKYCCLHLYWPVDTADHDIVL